MADEGLNELFGNNPDRPDKPEFWQLSEIVLKHDAEAEAENGIEKIIEKIIPEDVAGYMAVQRALYMLLHVPEFMLIRIAAPQQFLAMHLSAAAAWTDGFAAGAEFQKKYNGKVSECDHEWGPRTEADQSNVYRQCRECKLKMWED